VDLGIIRTSVPANPSFAELIVPGFVLASLSMAYVARLTRTSLIENTRADFVRTAVAKGLPRRRVVGVHMLRNSLIPVVTFLGTDIGALMGGAIVTEGVFNIRGIGGLIYRGLQQQDIATVVGVVALLVIVYLVANLVVDLLYAVLDPRIRYE
jgi:oligopeptide transport system permease protein